MSLAATRWAWTLRLGGYEKFTLLALADRANAEKECWPSLAVLAASCGIGRSTLKRCLSRLETKGYIERTPPPAHKRAMQSTRYRLRLDNPDLDPLTGIDSDEAIGPERALLGPDWTQDRAQSGPGYGPERAEDRPRAGPESINKPINESIVQLPSGVSGQSCSKNNHTNITNTDPLNGTAFERFWETYPKKRKKKTAHGIWQRKQLNAKLDTILADIAERRRRDVYWRDGYIPDPTTYLSQERWEDDITTHRPDSPARRKSGAEILAEGCLNAFK